MRSSRSATLHLAAVFGALLVACAPAPDAGAPAPAVARHPLPADTSRVHEERPGAALPTLLNREPVRRALVANYPTALRDRGASGEAVIALVVDENGAPRDVRVARGSGYREMDQAALRVVQVMRFEPVVREGVRVRQRISIPIVFEPA